MTTDTTSSLHFEITNDDSHTLKQLGDCPKAQMLHVKGWRSKPTSKHSRGRRRKNEKHTPPLRKNRLQSLDDADWLHTNLPQRSRGPLDERLPNSQRNGRSLREHQQ